MSNIKKRTFITLTPTQFLASSLLVGLVAGGITVLNSMYHEHRLLPIVVQAPVSKECVKVINLENGHAFNCQDKDVVLRRYRVTEFTEPTNEKLPAPNMQQMPANR